MEVFAMKILVLGANGMAGHTISIYFEKYGHEVTTLTRSFFGVGKNINLSIDYKNITKLEQIIQTGNYDGVLNCIGILNQYAEENKENAVFLNSYLPHFLSKVTEDMKTKIIHMSTDCVFSGISGSYSENSYKDGKTF